MATTTDTRTEKGVSLARGPALILGTILLIAGLYFLYKQHTFPKLSNFPSGTAHTDGKVFLGIFGANGWTGMLTAIGGGLLLFGAAQHLLAKAMSLIVAIGLGVAAIIAATSSGNVLGLAAGNSWTEIGWGAVALILLFNTVIPRRRRAIVTEAEGAPIRTGAGPVRRRDEAGVGGSGAGAVTTRHDPAAAAGEPVTTRHDSAAAEGETRPIRQGETGPPPESGTLNPPSSETPTRRY